MSFNHANLSKDQLERKIDELCEQSGSEEDLRHLLVENGFDGQIASIEWRKFDKNGKNQSTQVMVYSSSRHDLSCWLYGSHVIYA